MVRCYKKKGSKLDWSEDKMKAAVNSVIEEGITVVPKSRSRVIAAIGAMTPLDVGFMNPLSTYYTQIIESEHRRKNPVNLRKVFGLFGRVFIKAAKIETAINSFEKFGLVPKNKNAWSKEEFAIDPTTESKINRPDLDQNELSKCTNLINEITEPQKIVSSGAVNIDQQMIAQVSDQPKIQVPTDPNLLVLTQNSKVIVESAQLLIKYLSPLVPIETEIDGTENLNLASPMVNSINMSQEVLEKQLLKTNENLPKKRKKGQAAIITSDEYRDNLISIKKEKARKDVIKQKRQD
uniref:Uncharacterized protein n=1 Tax=Trichogramma kaykai TaxID=54128 RepID=A0ABD2X1Y9_9HYME